ncbi:MAG TPA: hypothetical protein VJP02_16490 [Candidatus Sulfotelmatobacter sp.]|nr:hypothetical protein [Candidatus Sulfotelmatobacter sp.]
MKFPFVTRKKYDRLMECARKFCARMLELEDEIASLKSEKDTILGNACVELHKRDELVAAERDALVAIYHNIRDGGAQ